jgi:BirA family biotin operon repressor/biotin-[acetyl-CoA-carboxylase] ligase
MWRDGKKLGGVLTESEIEGEQLTWVVVGLGLNVNIDFGQQGKLASGRFINRKNQRLPLAQVATSLAMILGEATDHLRLPILQRYLENVERRYEALRHGQSPHQEWEKRLLGIGQPVTVTVLGADERYKGHMLGVDENGALRVRQNDGTIATILAGDVTLK